MKNWVWLAVIVALVAAPASAGGGVGAAVAFWAPDDGSEELAPAIKLKIDLGTRWAAELRASFFNTIRTDPEPNVFELDVTPIDLGIVRQWDTAGPTEPYFGGGLTIYNLNSNIGEISTEPGWYGIVGFEVPAVQRWNFFAEAIFRSVSGEVEGDGIRSFVKQEADLTGAALNAGLIYSW